MPDLSVYSAGGPQAGPTSWQEVLLHGSDVRRVRFSGTLPAELSFQGNFIECSFDDVTWSGSNLQRCDWKDCHLKSVTFIDCDLGHAAILTNAFTSCRFIRCRFPDTSISDCTFLNCEFEECDLTHIIIKNSRFEAVRFSRCGTSNRIVESSILHDTTWEGMDIEADLLIGNFGLSRDQLSNCRLFRRLPQGARDVHDWSQVDEVFAGRELGLIERFRLSYFNTGSIDGDPDLLDRALDPRQWTGDAPIPASFASLLMSFSQFLLIQYAEGKCRFYPLLRFYGGNFDLLEWLAKQPELLPLYQASAGVHYTLNNEVSHFMAVLQRVFAAHGTSLVTHVGANGPLDTEHFDAFFKEIGLSGVRAISVRPRNSPVDLGVAAADSHTLLAFLALLLACRTKFDLRKQADSEGLDQEGAKGQSLIVFQTGQSLTKPGEFEISVNTLLPRSLQLELRLTMSMGMFKKAGRVLVELIGSEKKGGQAVQDGPQ
ncbi:MAG TPA: pentapeptide repeat-containing protein [Azospirillaceae bacterium]|nr:pentapeptide repeat-containing protein [Azospirillaceae bacterium]